MGKRPGRKLGKLENLGNPGNFILSFLISKFSILPYSQNRKPAFKNLVKNFSSFLRFPSFPSFRPDHEKTVKNDFVLVNVSDIIVTEDHQSPKMS